MAKDMITPLRTRPDLFDCLYANALEQHPKDDFDCLSPDEDYTPCPYVLTPVEAALTEDNKDQFAILIKSLSKSEISYAYCDMFSYDSINCFTAMLAGDLAPFLDTNFLLANGHHITLHDVAAMDVGCPKITAHLIHLGYSPDLRSDFISMDFRLKDALPLNVALESYCAYLWPGGSAIHFFTSFLEAPLATLETIEILARKTREVKHEFSKYLTQGKMVEVGILLAVARECILSTAEGNDDTGFKDISEMHKFLSSEILKLSVDATTAQLQCKTQLLEMKNTLDLLEIFDKIGDKLIALGQTAHNGTSEVESLIKGAGFDVDVLKTNSEFRRSVRLLVVDKGLLPSSFDEQEFCDRVAKYGLTSDIKIPWPNSVSMLPSRITIIIGQTRFPGIVGFDEV